MENLNAYGYQFVNDYKYTIFGHADNSQKTINDFFILKRFVDLNWINNKISKKLWRKSEKLHPNNEKTRLDWFHKNLKREAKNQKKNGNSAVLIKYPLLLENLLIKENSEEKIFSFEDGSKFELDFIIPKSKELNDFKDSDYSLDSIEVSISEFLYDQKKQILMSKDGYYKRPSIWGHIYLINKKNRRIHGSKKTVKIPLQQVKELLINLTKISNSLDTENIARLQAQEKIPDFSQIENEAMQQAIKNTSKKSTKILVTKKKNNQEAKKIEANNQKNPSQTVLLANIWSKAWENKKREILYDQSICYCNSRGLNELDIDIGQHFPDCPKYQN